MAVKSTNNQKGTIANEKAKERTQTRLDYASTRPVSIPKMPAWKINALNQIGIDTLRQVLDKLDSSNRVLVIRPTGFGKSYMLAGLTSCGNFKKCLYIYPNEVIKTDMTDTYGMLGDDDRACTLRNTTFITYTMLGNIVGKLGLKITDTDSDEDSDVADNGAEKVFSGTLTLRKLTYENEVYDVSDIGWYRKLLKNKKALIKKYKDEIDSYKQLKSEYEEELNSLKARKSKAIKRLNTLDTLINDANNHILKYGSKLHKLNVLEEKQNSIDTIIDIESVDKLREWLGTFDLIIADEAHKTGASRFISLWQNVLYDLVVNKTAGHEIKMVGATATPYRLDGRSIENYVFGDNSRLREININDCIKANNWEKLGIDLNEILSDDAVIDEGTTEEYLRSRGLFKTIDYIYTIRDLDQFSLDVIEYLNKQRQSDTKITETIKDELLKNVITDRAIQLRNERTFCKLDQAELNEYKKADSDTAIEIKKVVSKGMNDAQKQYALTRCNTFKRNDLRNIFTKMIRYHLTTEDVQYLISEAKNNRNTDTKLLRSISREENHLKPDEEMYIRRKISEMPNLTQLLRHCITGDNTYNLRYMKFIIFFPSSAALTAYVHRNRDSNTILGTCFDKAFPGYYIHEAALHTGVGTRGMEKISPSDLDNLKPTDRVIDLIYCVDQLNMGYHVENITGVILLRNTESASIYNQQIGRCCSVRAENNTVMIDIIDKKSIGDIIDQAYDSYDYTSLNTDGSQKDLRHLLDPECINICDFNKTLIEIINNMKDMRFTDREKIRFLYFDRQAPFDAIVHMTGMDKELVNEILKELITEQEQIDNAKR